MRKQDITYQDKLIELRLDISHPNSKGKAFVLLEGKSDLVFYRKFFSSSNCKLETIPGSKLKVEQCIGELAKDSPIIIGIIDADFIHLGAKSYDKVNVFLTDFHDMEMMLISEDEIFSALMFEYTDLSKDKYSETRNNIMFSIEQISYLKWLNEEEDLDYNFKFGFHEFISFENFKINFSQYFARVLNKSPNAKIKDEKIILEKMKALKDTDPHPLQLCNGHDFMKAISYYLNQVFNVKGVNHENVASSCRMTFSFNHYSSTELYNNTKMWADKNKCVIYEEQK